MLVVMVPYAIAYFTWIYVHSGSQIPKKPARLISLPIW